MSQREQEAIARLRHALGNQGDQTLVSTRDLSVLLSAAPPSTGLADAFMAQFEDLRAQALAGAIS